MLDDILLSEAPRNSGKPKLSYQQLTASLVRQAFYGKDSLSTHMKELYDITISDAALSGRKESIGWEFAAHILDQVLQPIADPTQHPDAFYKGLRLVAGDLTKLDLQNTPAILAQVTKAKSPTGTGHVAFPQMNCEVLVELGMFNPLAVALSWDGRGELTLARDILPAIPEQSLFLGDRLYGSPWFLHEATASLQPKSSHYLVRVKEGLNARKVEPLADGSHLVEVDVMDPHTSHKVDSLALREIRVLVHVEGEVQPTEIRLWTSLLEPEEHPALELAALYARRWSHELFYREIKQSLHRRDSLLKAQSVTGAALEVLATMLAAALLARQRATLAEAAEVPASRISFRVVLEETRSLLLFLQIAATILSQSQQAELTRLFWEKLQWKALIKPRKARRCQRGKRKTVSSWQKISNPTSQSLIVRYEILPSKP